MKATKSAKERSWKDFLERYGVAEGGPANPWETLHRQAAGKTKKKGAFIRALPVTSDVMVRQVEASPIHAEDQVHADKGPHG